MVNALDCGVNSPDLGPGWGHCVVFFGKPLYSHSASLHPGVRKGTGEFNAGGNPAMDLHPIQGGVERWKYSWSLYAIETGISSSWINHSAHM